MFVGQLDDMFEMSNLEAANILRKLVRHLTLMIARGNGKSLTVSRYAQAMSKAIDILENTPDEAKPKKKSKYQYLKLCPDCDEKDFHPVVQLNGESRNKYKHKCPKCGNVWYECDDE